MVRKMETVKETWRCRQEKAPCFFSDLDRLICMRQRCDVLLVWRSNDSTLGQAQTKRVGIGRLIVDHSLGFLFRSPRTGARNGDRFEERLDERNLRRCGTVQELSQRNTLAVDHHHPLRTLSTLGFSNARPPFFAGAKLPSAKTSDQSSKPCSSSSARNARQARIQAPCSSQSCSRRQQVEGDGNSSGRSFQRAPLRSTQRMPSKQGRLGSGLRPPFA